MQAALGGVELEFAPPASRFTGIGRPHVEADVAEKLINRVAALAAQRPVVLALEDVQWADSGSLAVLGRLARRLADLRVLVVATARRTPCSARGRTGSAARCRRR
ncbi:MAG: AAA family ATPase [Acidimicrobiales bacterium]